ncbi:hypothetical protein ITP53_52255 [Nonomuraea sp. K274]|uniref:Uncharacterized protein n=1 Tax=Nonomuraea cypriaca TaxID=1187855 RepID=A0A931F5X0_9ACTN|nr:hypothetical protein [Nonomuraea cypriaca]MBF8194107.1 hypothetical protein [Nonomuraea cypriaca]
MPASGREAYTALRGRLIVTNGYCGGGCAEGRAESAEQTQQVVRPQQLGQAPQMGQQVSHPQQAGQESPQGRQMPGAAPVRVAR